MYSIVQYKVISDYLGSNLAHVIHFVNSNAYKYNLGSSTLSQMGFTHSITEWWMMIQLPFRYSFHYSLCLLYQFLGYELRTLWTLPEKGSNGVVTVDKREKIMITDTVCNARRYISWVSCSLTLQEGEYNWILALCYICFCVYRQHCHTA
jgi:hypothetical protein